MLLLFLCELFLVVRLSSESAEDSVLDDFSALFDFFALFVFELDGLSLVSAEDSSPVPFVVVGSFL